MKTRRPSPGHSAESRALGLKSARSDIMYEGVVARTLASDKSKTRRRLMIILGQSACAECGTSEFCLLDFHHTKGDGGSDRRSFGPDWERHYVNHPEEALRAGLVVLCANCHRRRHHGSRPPPDSQATRFNDKRRAMTIYLKPGSRMPSPEELSDFLNGLREK